MKQAAAMDESTQNPYQPPADLATVSVVVDEAGVWRDGKYLVMEKADSVFPMRCVKSNEPVRELTQIQLDWTPVPLAMKILFGLLIAKAIWGKSLAVSVGLSEVFRSRRKRWIAAGWGLVVGGIVGLILFTFAYVGITIAGFGTDHPVVTMIPLGLSFTSMGGLPVLVVAYLPIMRVHKSTPSHLWIASVNQEFLAELPEWDGHG